jgi:hypothetical protein
MDKYTKEDLAKALRTIASLIANCEKAQLKFAEGTPQYSLLRNRLKALRISEGLITNEAIAGKFTKEELTEALRPIASIISKCEKAQMKLAVSGSQHTRLDNIIRAMRLAKNLIADEMSKG